MQDHVPQHRTHVGWTHNAIAGIVYIPSIVPEPVGNNNIIDNVNHIVRLGVY